MRSLLVLLLLARAGWADSACKAKADDVAKYLTSMDHDAEMLPALPIDLVTRTDLPNPPTYQAIVVVVQPDGIRFKGKVMTGPQLEAALKEHLGSFDDRSATLFIDRAARWSSVHAALAALRAARSNQLSFVFLKPAPVPPPHTIVDDEFAKAPDLAKYIRTKIAACPAMVELMRRGWDSGDRAGVVVNGVGPALLACDCAVSPAEMLSLFAQLVGNKHPSGQIVVSFDAKAKRLDAGNDAKWVDVQKQLAATTTAIWIR